jgi:hypothetical protein
VRCCRANDGATSARAELIAALLQAAKSVSNLRAFDEIASNVIAQRAESQKM